MCILGWIQQSMGTRTVNLSNIPPASKSHLHLQGKLTPSSLSGAAVMLEPFCPFLPLLNGPPSGH